MTTFPLTPAQIEAASGYDLIMALETFWRANGLRLQNLTDRERKAEALHWATRQA